MESFSLPEGNYINVRTIETQPPLSNQASEVGSTATNGANSSQLIFPAKASIVEVWIPIKSEASSSLTGFLRKSTPDVAPQLQSPLGSRKVRPSHVLFPDPASMPNPSANKMLKPLKGHTSSFIKSVEGVPISQSVFKTIAETQFGGSVFIGGIAGGGTGKTVNVCDFSPIEGKNKDALCKLTFPVTPSAIALNNFNASSTQLSFLVGFDTGDILWFDPIIAKYTRLNKSGQATSSPVTSLNWLPIGFMIGVPADALSRDDVQINSVGGWFASTHADGSIFIWDRDRDDLSGSLMNITEAINITPTLVSDLPLYDTPNTPSVGAKSSFAELSISKPVVNPNDKEKKTKTALNPVTMWKTGSTPITDLSTSPDGKYVAVVGDDGLLRIIEAASERILDCFQGYFGGLTCTAWSPDSKFVVTGGQDDLCAVYVPYEQSLVAYGEGHCSYLSKLAWDPWKSDPLSWRFVSVGQDTKLLVWELSEAGLVRPKPAKHQHLAHHTASNGRNAAHYHPSPRRAEVPVLLPLTEASLGNDIIVDVYVFERFIITIARLGQIKIWERPDDEI